MEVLKFKEITICGLKKVSLVELTYSLHDLFVVGSRTKTTRLFTIMTHILLGMFTMSQALPPENEVIRVRKLILKISKSKLVSNLQKSNLHVTMGV